MDTTNTQHYDAPLLIDGEWTDAEEGRTLDILNPATGEVIGALASASASDVDRAVQAGHRAFEGGAWRDMSIQQRARIMNRFADLFEADLEQFYKLETLNNGRPISGDARANFAAATVLPLLRGACAHAPQRRDSD